MPTVAAPNLVAGAKMPSDVVVAGTGFEPVKLTRRIYSPLPLAARATCRLAGYNERVDRAQTASTHRKVRSNGGLIVRHRQQGRPPGGRQRAKPGRQGAVDAF